MTWLGKCTGSSASRFQGRRFFTNVVADLETNVPLLTKNVDGTPMAEWITGRKFLLAKLYMNSQVIPESTVDAAMLHVMRLSTQAIFSGMQFILPISDVNKFRFQGNLSLPYPTTRYLHRIQYDAATLHYASQYTYNPYIQHEWLLLAREVLYSYLIWSPKERCSTLTGPATNEVISLQVISTI